MPDYVVEIKPSARRVNGAVGSVVNRRGTRRRFEAREDAEAWATGLTAQGEATVFVRAANPGDTTGADAYLMGVRPGRAQSSTTGGPEADQSSLPADGE